MRRSTCGKASPVAADASSPIFVDRIGSPLGVLTALQRSDALIGLYMTEQRHAPAPQANWIPAAEPFAELRSQLAEYFSGQRTRFDLKLAPQGTPFQKKVWQLLLQIPCGQTRSYGQLAEQLGQPGAARAVGLANGRNPIGILIPCHRVVGSQGALTGYGGGLARKRWLLTHEQEAQLSGPQRRLFSSREL